jgi:hypothetical protein
MAISEYYFPLLKKLLQRERSIRNKIFGRCRIGTEPLKQFREWELLDCGNSCTKQENNTIKRLIPILMSEVILKI